jgi:cytochrome P450
MSEPPVVTITTYAEARDALRHKGLRQALYDAGEVIMADVLVNLHGAEHRDRRRFENRLFTRDALAHYERDLFPPILRATLADDVRAGRTELVDLGHRMMMNVAALTAGVDRPLGTAEETRRLYDYLLRFVEGATLAHYTGDRDERAAVVRRKLAEFDEAFVTPSIERRVASRRDAGGRVAPPRDVLTVLLANADALRLSHDVIVREVAFFLLAGAHTSATAFTRVTHDLFTWLAAHPDDRARIAADRGFVQRCTHETVRLHPASPVAMRWALDDLTLPGGRAVPRGAKVVIDLEAVNRDPEVFGADADTFDPQRAVPAGVAPYGLSFGTGMHACIGQDLAAGLVPTGDGPSGDHLFGLVPEAVQALFEAGARPDPADPAVPDPTTTRPYFARYPVLLDGGDT